MFWIQKSTLRRSSGSGVISNTGIAAAAGGAPSQETGVREGRTIVVDTQDLGAAETLMNLPLIVSAIYSF